MAGAFLASPELRVYAANTIGSADIINNSILSADIKDGEVKTVDLGNDAVTSAKIKNGEVKTDDIAPSAIGSLRLKDNDVKAVDIAADAVGSSEIATNAVGADEIAPDAVGASEIKGVDKLIFADCKVPAGSGLPGATMGFQCTVAGVDSEDNAIAALSNPTTTFNACYVIMTNKPGEGNVGIIMKNVCTTTHPFPAGVTVSIIVYDELPDKVLP